MGVIKKVGIILAYLHTFVRKMPAIKDGGNFFILILFKNELIYKNIQWLNGWKNLE